MIFKCVSEGHCGHRVATGLDKNNSEGRGPVKAIQVYHDGSDQGKGMEDRWTDVEMCGHPINCI